MNTAVAEQPKTEIEANNNMSVWDQVCKTDPSATKSYKGPGGFEGTSINFASVICKATEIFGPVGIGWGYEIVEERIDDGAPIMENNETLGHPVEIAKLQTHTIRLKLWAMIDGKRAEVEHYGHTPYTYKNKWGVQSDGEASKKSLTDAIKKCLSMFGMNADIYLGMYDDTAYVQHRKNQVALEKADDKAEEAKEQAEDYSAWQEDALRLIAESVHMNMLKGLFTTAVRKAELNQDKPFILKLTKAKDKRKEELEENEPTAA